MASLGPTLELRGVGKDFPGGVKALDGIDLEIAAGESVALIGESGSGKSTLLRLFNRMTIPSRGSVHREGEDLATADLISLRRRTGYVQQEGGLLPHWTVGRNVELVPKLLGWSADRRRRRTDELLAWLGLAPDRFAHRYPTELSGGQRQRVALARSLAGEPGVLLLDEPFGALDPLLREDLWHEFSNLKESLSQTIVLVTHDLREAFALGDRVGVLKDGHLLQLATPEELRETPRPGYVEKLLRRGGVLS